MSLPLTILLTILFLLPGLLYIVGRNYSVGSFRYEAPKPNSLTVVVIAPFISLIFLVAISLLSVLNDALVAHNFVIFEGYRIDLVKIMFDRDYLISLSSIQVYISLLLYFLGCLLLLFRGQRDARLILNNTAHPDYPWFQQYTTEAKIEGNYLCAEVWVNMGNTLIAKYYGTLSGAKLDNNGSFTQVKLLEPFRQVLATDTDFTPIEYLYNEQLYGITSLEKDNIISVHVYIGNENNERFDSVQTNLLSLQEQVIPPDIDTTFNSEDNNIISPIDTSNNNNLSNVILVKDLDLDDNIKSILNKNGIVTVPQLKAFSPKEILAIKGIGKTRLDKISATLYKY